MAGLIGLRVGIPATEWGEPDGGAYWGTIVQMGLDTNGNECLGIKLDGGSLFHWPTPMVLSWLDQHDCAPDIKRARLGSSPPTSISRGGALELHGNAVAFGHQPIAMEDVKINVQLVTKRSDDFCDVKDHKLDAIAQHRFCGFVAAAAGNGGAPSFPTAAHRLPLRDALQDTSTRSTLVLQAPVQGQGETPAHSFSHRVHELGLSAPPPPAPQQLVTEGLLLKRPLLSRGLQGRSGGVSDKEGNGSHGPGPDIYGSQRQPAADAMGPHLSRQSSQSRTRYQLSSDSVSNACPERHDVDTGASPSQWQVLHLEAQQQPSQQAPQQQAFQQQAHQQQAPQQEQQQQAQLQRRCHNDHNTTSPAAVLPAAQLPPPGIDATDSGASACVTGDSGTATNLLRGPAAAESLRPGGHRTGAVVPCPPRGHNSPGTSHGRSRLEAQGQDQDTVVDAVADLAALQPAAQPLSDQQAPSHGTELMRGRAAAARDTPMDSDQGVRPLGGAATDAAVPVGVGAVGALPQIGRYRKPSAQLAKSGLTGRGGSARGRGAAAAAPVGPAPGVPIPTTGAAALAAGIPLGRYIC